jgi:hypothetical protein
MIQGRYMLDFRPEFTPAQAGAEMTDLRVLQLSLMHAFSGEKVPGPQDPDKHSRFVLFNHFY